MGSPALGEDVTGLRPRSVIIRARDGVCCIVVTINMHWPDRRRRPVSVALPEGYTIRSWVDRAAFAAIQASHGVTLRSGEWEELSRDLVPGAMVFAFAPDDEPVAVALVRDRERGGHAELSWVATVPAHGGQGLAQAVCAEATSRALDAGCLDLQLSTGAELHAAQHIYFKQGWVIDLRYP